MAVTNIFLIRHGQYIMDKTSSDFGKLTKLGVEQCGYLQGRIKQLEIDEIHYSTMERAKETALVVFPDHEKMRGSRLLWEGIPYFPRKLRLDRKMDVISTREQKNRMDGAFARFFKPAKGEAEKNVVLVCHGNIIRYFISLTIQAKPAVWLNFDINQASLSQVKINHKSEMKVVLFNEISYMPKSHQTMI